MFLKTCIAISVTCNYNILVILFLNNLKNSKQHFTMNILKTFCREKNSNYKSIRVAVAYTNYDDYLEWFFIVWVGVFSLKILE